MILRGGENIYPREVEDFLYTHPELAEVQVIGVPDEKYGEEICACIIPKPSSQATGESIKKFCTGKIAHFKIPRYFLFVEQFPLTVTGKVQKYKLREIFNKKLEKEDKNLMV